MKKFLPLNLQFFAEDPQDNPEPNNNGDKTFTQEDVNRIVSERLAKEKAKYEANSQAKTQKREAELSKREQELLTRELKATARETLMNKNLPKDLLDVVNYSSEEEMNKSIDILAKTYGTGRGSVTDYSPQGGQNIQVDQFRAAFNLPK